MTLEERFLSKICEVNGCWLWTGYLYHGYGKFRVVDKLLAAHRLSYELFLGSIPEGMEVDHTCHNNANDCADGDACLHRSCVNPDHLEVVTGAENKRRSPNWMGNKKLCKRGHEFDGVAKHNGQRWCSQCARVRQIRYKQCR